ncbi:polyprenyl synthetase family protein [Piscirickettsia litoralis]|uniref:Octaprenyl diphosphate synthase n=1 Tax=Piscirickettsia litoralis TaxID=1891921 RepID=A0ABX3A354_9GAMM|nr:polyprenyl synthetase family protein [Piscirickettsia litoralis]ODN42667.1 octaprenyl diphosphate synthase [Piscirickettsia litoralis]
MSITLKEVKQIVSEDLAATDQLIIESLSSDVALVDQIGHYITNSSGKRLRPLLVLLAAKSVNYNGKAHIKLAAVIEFIHNATLLHDDVVDESDMRRGNKTANVVWNNAASILVGDFLYSRAFQLMTEVGIMRVMQVLADATNQIAEGEVLQLMHCNNPDTSEQDYYKVIERKTATLFATACKLGAIINDNDSDTENALGQYGLHLGNAFQIIDDVLDYSADSNAMGKNLGDDLAEGKPTLPLIYALANSQGTAQQQIHQAITSGGLEHLEQILQTIKHTGALGYARDQAHHQASLAIRALEPLPLTPYKQALVQIAELSLQRNS